jgi:hypothetical protein
VNDLGLIAELLDPTLTVTEAVRTRPPDGPVRGRPPENTLRPPYGWDALGRPGTGVQERCGENR